MAASKEDIDPNEVVAGDDPEASPAPSRGGRKRKRDANTLRKAPQAPRRFKSSYICFFMAKQDEIKAEIKAEAEAGGTDSGATVTDVSKRSAEKWRNLPAEERSYWEDVAAKDKQRYMAEKAVYTGPWQVPWKRAKKDPSAPKRPMSAFLYFSQDRRKKIKEKNPSMKNTEVSRVLGNMWRNASEEEKRPHILMEVRERKKYKVAIAQWKEETKAKEEAVKKAHEEQQRQYMSQAMGPYGGQPPPLPLQDDPSQQQPPPPPLPSQAYDPNAMYQQPLQPYGMPPQNAPYGYTYPPPQQGYPPMYSPYPTPTGPDGQPIILGPDGVPQGAPMHYGPPQAMPPPGQFAPPYGPPLPQNFDEEGGGPLPQYPSYPIEPQYLTEHDQMGSQY